MSSGYCCAGTPQPGACNIYYVSSSLPAASDGNDGLTQASPWKTLQYAEQTATAAGSIIALRKGDVWASTTAIAITQGGSGASPIVWDGSLWGSGAAAVIRSSANRADGNDSVINIIGCSNVRFQHITVDGNNTKTYGLVVGGHTGFSLHFQNNETNIVIDDCSILNCGNGSDYRQALLVQTFYTNMSNITVVNCTLDGSDDEQLTFYPGKTQDGSSAMEISNIVIRNNTLTNWGRRGQSTGYGMQINNKCTNVLIEHNTLVQGPDGIGNALQIESNELTPTYMPSGVTVRYNWFDVPRSNEWDVYVQGGQAVTADFYYNVFIQGSNTTDEDGGAVWIASGALPYTGAALNFWNNTIYTTSGRSFQNDCATINAVTLINNVIYNAGVGGDNIVCLKVNTAGSTIHRNNAYYRSTDVNGLKVIDGAYRSTAAQIKDTWETTAQVPTTLPPPDPIFVAPGSDFSLAPGSLCIGKGEPLGLSPDYAGHTVDSSPDIGAFESP